MDKVDILQDLKDDCRSVGWDGYIPAIEALEAENAALRAELAARGPGLSDDETAALLWAENQARLSAQDGAGKAFYTAVATVLRNLLERNKR